jgi:hypothetical protein
MPVTHDTGFKVPSEKRSAHTLSDDWMELDSPMASPRTMREPVDDGKGRDGSSVHEIEGGNLSFVFEVLVSILDIVAHESKSSSEDAPVAAYRKLAYSLMRQCNILTTERDVAARALYELRQVVVKQRVSRMEHEADLEDVISRLEDCNPRLRRR